MMGHNRVQQRQAICDENKNEAHPRSHGAKIRGLRWISQGSKSCNTLIFGTGRVTCGVYLLLRNDSAVHRDKTADILRRGQHQKNRHVVSGLHGKKARLPDFFSERIGVNATFGVVKESMCLKLNPMLKSFILIAATCLTLDSFSLEIQQDLKPFTRVVASPRVSVILEKGDRESIRLVYDNVDAEKVNVQVIGKTLRIYLDDARKVEKTIRTDRGRVSIYEGVSVTAYVTYRELDLLEVRGNQEITCLDPIDSEIFVLRAYGENEIRLAYLKTGFFKAKLYGSNDLEVLKGRTLEQKYVLYGENKIDTKGMRSDYIITSIFGEGSLRINSAEEVRIDAFGEPRIFVDGGAHVNRRLIFGKANIYEN